MEAVSRGILVFYISYADRARTCHVHPGSNPVATEVSARLSENLPEIVFIKVPSGNRRWRLRWGGVAEGRRVRMIAAR
jgi:hypothetical protein